MYKIIEGYKILPRQTWYEDENYHMTYEEIDGVIFIHIEIATITKSVFKDIKQKWEDFKAKLYWLGHEWIFTYTTDLRIPNMIGGGKVVGKWNDKDVVAWELT